MGYATTVMKQRGPSHAVGYRIIEARRHGRTNQCTRADGKGVLQSYKNKFHVPLTSPTSLEMLKRALEGSGRPLIVTSSAAVLGDTGSVPLGEDGRVRPLRGFAWLARLEKEILQASDTRSIVVRPAWQIHGSRPPRPIALGLVGLAKRFRRGKYIGADDNAYSAVHFDDLAALYSVALNSWRSNNPPWC